MKTPWMKPVAERGGITALIAAEVSTWYDDEALVIVHAYREVGTSLEAVLEIHHEVLGCKVITMGNRIVC